MVRIGGVNDGAGVTVGCVEAGGVNAGLSSGRDFHIGNTPVHGFYSYFRKNELIVSSPNSGPAFLKFNLTAV